MTARFNLVAIVLGLAVATAAVGDASARTIVKTVATHAAGKTIHKTVKVIAHRPHRVVLGKRIVKAVRLVHRAPATVKVVKAVAPAKSLRVTKTVRLVKRPVLRMQTLAHRVVVKKTVIR